MPRTISQFGRSEDLVTNDNPKGIFAECKECRYKNNDSLNSRLEHAKCPNCGKIANGSDQVKELFGLRVLNGKYTTVQSWCFECRKDKNLNISSFSLQIF